jgi:hypothetical protein
MRELQAVLLKPDRDPELIIQKKIGCVLGLNKSFYGVLIH